MLEVQNLSFNYPGHTDLFSPISFKLKKGECLAIKGPSGSGKTSLLKIIHGSLTASGGQITKPQTLFIPQDFGLTPSLPAWENVALGFVLENPWSQILNRVKQDQREKVQITLKSLGFETAQIDQVTQSLSGGEQQRVALARALVTQIPLILLDEPTSQLDWDRSLDVLKLIKANCKNNNRSALIVSHDERLIEVFADQIVELVKPLQEICK